MNNKKNSVFNLEKFYEAKRKTKEVVQIVASKVETGMSEKDGVTLINTILKDYSCEKFWHPHKFRIGRNTTKAFREVSEENIQMKQNDIFFIDIGPVFENHEGDYGETFIHGNKIEYSDIIQASKNIFNATKDKWKTENLSGQKLYDFATKATAPYGYTLNPQMKGHYLSDFPHALHCKSKLAEVAEYPQPNLWVLEILITDPSNEFGAFFEDLLI